MNDSSNPTTLPHRHTVELQGKTYTLPPFEVEDFDAVERRIIDLRPNPMKMVIDAVKGLPSDQAADIIRLAVKETSRVAKVSSDEFLGFMRSLEGLAYSLWICLRKAYPNEFTPASLLAELHAIGNTKIKEQLEEMFRRREQSPASA